jgi:hypothetical protein
VNVLCEGVKLEGQPKVIEAIVGGDAVAVHLRVLSDGHDVRPNTELPVEGDQHTVGRSSAGDGQLRDAAGRPLVGVIWKVHWLAVQGDIQMLDDVVPGVGLPSADVEAVATIEEHGDGLDPSEVPRHAALATLADEVHVNVEVAIGDHTEVGIPTAMEVEGVAVTADKPRVATRPRGVAHCMHNHEPTRWINVRTYSLCSKL